MKGNNFIYLLKEGARNVWVNRLMSIASIGVLIACMLLMGGAMLISYNINEAVGYVENQNEVVVFLNEEMSSEQTESVGTQLESIGNISKSKFVSKDESLDKMISDMGESEEIMDGLLTQNPLLDSYEISISDLSKLKETVSAIEGIDGVYKVVSPTEAADTLTSVKRIVNIAGMAIIAILFVVSVVIIANTIKITIFNRRKEVSIMKYVGATDWFIKFPFIVEGIIIGLISSVIAYGMLWLGYQYLLENLMVHNSSWLRGVAESFIPFDTIALTVAVGFFGSGIGIGAIGSSIFVSKYLKV